MTDADRIKIHTEGCFKVATWECPLCSKLLKVKVRGYGWSKMSLLGFITMHNRKYHPPIMKGHKL